MPEMWVLELAEQYGRNPSEIEQEWEPFWISRALKRNQANNIKWRRENPPQRKPRAR